MRTHNPKHNRFGRTGFTLIEVLIVITIIGILIGLLIPAVGIAYRSVKKSTIAMEVLTISDAVEKYKAKYGDYPPDGSNAAVMTRHLRKIFPQIAATELTLLTGGSNSSTGLSGAVMDPPEALVFFLGGFSEDPVHPFTGAGGPFAPSPDGSTSPIQYNVDRNAPLFEFKEDQLSLVVINDPGSGAPITVSDDEMKLGLPAPTGFPGDLIPVYTHSGSNAPLVYFDSRTYSVGGQFNRYQPFGFGVARPYKSDKVNTTTGTTFGDAYYRYAEDKSFQLISAGLDDLYGGLPTDSPGAVPLFFKFPTGETLDITKTLAAQTPRTRYIEVEGEPSAQLDNATNFSEGVLEDKLSN